MSDFPLKKMSLNEAIEHLRELGPPILDLDAEPTCMSDYVSPEDQIVWVVYGAIVEFRPADCGMEKTTNGSLAVFGSEAAANKFFPQDETEPATLTQAMQFCRAVGWPGVTLYDINGKIVGEWPC